MKIDTNLHAEEWKTGTEALAFCMICGGEYPPATPECPDCHVSLSVVRRCPGCHKIVSAQHKKCVYCRTPFIEEIPRALPEFLPELQAQDERTRRIRAGVVSVATFLVVFFLGMFFVRMIQKPVVTIQVIAKARMLQTVPARRSPTSNSSNLGKIPSGTPVNVTGYQETDQGRWMALDWNDIVAYVPLGDLSAPRAVNSDGAGALKFYIGGMDTAESARESLAAVAEYAKAFPADAHLDELRWELAERLRVLAQRGGPQSAELRRQSTQLYEQLAAGNGSFAAKARAALRTPASAHSPARSGAVPRKDTLQIIGGSGTRTSGSQSAPRQVTIR